MVLQFFELLSFDIMQQCNLKREINTFLPTKFLLEHFKTHLFQLRTVYVKTFSQSCQPTFARLCCTTCTTNYSNYHFIAFFKCVITTITITYLCCGFPFFTDTVLSAAAALHNYFSMIRFFNRSLYVIFFYYYIITLLLLLLLLFDITRLVVSLVLTVPNKLTQISYVKL